MVVVNSVLARPSQKAGHNQSSKNMENGQIKWFIVQYCVVAARLG